MAGTNIFSPHLSRFLRPAGGYEEARSGRKRVGRVYWGADGRAYNPLLSEFRRQFRRTSPTLFRQGRRGKECPIGRWRRYDDIRTVGHCFSRRATAALERKTPSYPTPGPAPTMAGGGRITPADPRARHAPYSGGQLSPRKPAADRITSDGSPRVVRTMAGGQITGKVSGPWPTTLPEFDNLFHFQTVRFTNGCNHIRPNGKSVFPYLRCCSGRKSGLLNEVHFSMGWVLFYEPNPERFKR